MSIDGRSKFYWIVSWKNHSYSDSSAGSLNLLLSWRYEKLRFFCSRMPILVKGSTLFYDAVIPAGQQTHVEVTVMVRVTRDWSHGYSQFTMKLFLLLESLKVNFTLMIEYAWYRTHSADLSHSRFEIFVSVQFEQYLSNSVRGLQFYS